MKAQLSTLKRKMKNGSLYATRFRDTIKSGSNFDIDYESDESNELLIMNSDDSWTVECFSLISFEETIVYCDEDDEINLNDIAIDASDDPRHLIPITIAITENKLNEVAKLLNLDCFF